MKDYGAYVVRDEPPEDGGVVIWHNPDIPPVDKIASGEVEEFTCPYGEWAAHQPMRQKCDPCEFNVHDDEDKAFEALLRKIKQSDGTLRCEDCEEPLYGLYGDGDHDDN